MKTLESASFLYALVELLSEGGLVGADREGMSRGRTLLWKLIIVADGNDS